MGGSILYSKALVFFFNLYFIILLVQSGQATELEKLIPEEEKPIVKTGQAENTGEATKTSATNYTGMCSIFFVVIFLGFQLTLRMPSPFF